MIDIATIRKWWEVFVGDGNMVEVRILGKFQYSGYFKSLDNLIKEITPYSEMDNEQIYFTLNKINPDCYGRQQCEKIVKSPKMTTTDGDIVCRNYVLLDFDPIRATGVNSNDEELEYAHEKAREVMRYLRKEGFKDPVVCKSGNGFHLILRAHLPNDEPTTEILKRFLQSMGKMFSDEHIEVDEKVFNAGRISKLYGTIAKKGANIPERPWRMSEILYVPHIFEINDISLFQKIADLLPKEEPKTVPNRNFRNQLNTNAPFDLRTWLNEHDIVYKEEKQGTSVRFTLEYCPWVDTHSEKKKWDSALFLDPDGKVTFNCTHSHCKNRTWHDVRLFYEPDAYDKPAYVPQSYRAPLPQKPKYEVKGEIPEYGKKWLKMSDIKKIDIYKLEGVKTGYTELDRNLSKLHWGEVTLLSGSNASGKSSWLNNLILNVANQGVQSALWSGELPEPILKAWIQMPAAGKDWLYKSQYGDDKYYVPNNIGERIDRWLDNWLLIYNTEYGSQWEQLFADMEEVVEQGVKLIVLDNLMAMDINLLEGDKNEKQKQVILKVKKFAKDKNVHIILVAHPRKATAFLRKNDISGTADLQNAVDNILIFHRVNNDFLRAGAEFFGKTEIERYQNFGNVCEIAKNRLFGINDLMVGMHYEIESRRFKNDPNEVIHYGWELEPVEGTIGFENDEGGQLYQNYYESGSEGSEMADMPFAAAGMDSDDAPPF